ncbi:major facilitator superfamily domain-containing protein [Xylaria palmicola]|nr:major facilitator superfamily domain-containing protein [Xylaria palmicola]
MESQTYAGNGSSETAPLLSSRSSSNGETGAAGVENGSPQIDAAATPGGPPKPELKMAALMPALAIGIFLVAFDQTLTIATYGRIGSDLRALNSTGWVATSYFLTLTTFQPLYGRLSDIFGRRPCLLFAYAVFGLGCLGCGLARDIVQLCVARAVAGAGGGGMNALVTILVTDLVSLRDRGVWQGYINIVFAAGVSAGAPIGGLFADNIGWRWAFLMQCPIALLAFVAVYVVLRLPQTDHTHWSAKFRRVDFAGALVLLAAVFLLLLGLDNGSNAGWGEAVTVAPLALAPLLFAAFALVEARVAGEPFAPGRVVLHPPLLAAYGANFFGVAGQMAVLFFAALFLQAALGLSATASGLAFLPSTAFALAGSLGGGLALRRTGRYYWLTAAGYCLLLVSIVPMVLGAGRASALITVVGLCVLTFGSSISITTSLIAIIANAAPEDSAVAVACSYLFRSLGTTIGISVSTAVLQQALRADLARRLGGSADRAREIEEQVRLSLDYIRRLDPDVALVVRGCYATATQWAFVPVAVFGALAVASSLFIKEKKLDR